MQFIENVVHFSVQKCGAHSPLENQEGKKGEDQSRTKSDRNPLLHHRNYTASAYPYSQRVTKRCQEANSQNNINPWEEVSH